MAVLGPGSSIKGDRIETVGEVRALGFSLSADSADTTSTLSKYAAGVPTTIQSNSIFISLYFDGSSNGEAKKFVDEFKLKRVSTWTITFSDGGVFRSEGYASNVTVASSFDNAIVMDLNISLVGEPEFI